MLSLTPVIEPFLFHVRGDQGRQKWEQPEYHGPIRRINCYVRPLNRERIKEESCAAEAEEEGAVDGLPPSSEWTRRGLWYILGPVGEYD